MEMREEKLPMMSTDNKWFSSFFFLVISCSEHLQFSVLFDASGVVCRTIRNIGFADLQHRNVYALMLHY